MTFREFMKENGNEIKTMFWEDFSIAERFVLSAIQDTFNRAFKEWKEDYEFLTELVLVLNHKIWQYHVLLANMYAAPYEKDKANNTPGVPLKLTSYMEDLKFKRTRLDTLYSSIIHDLKESAICLEKINEDQVFKANAHAANLLLSRVYLYMGEWEEALKSCEKVSNRLYHLEKLSLPYSQNFFRVSCPELIFAQGSECAANIFGAFGGYCFRVSDGLIGLYQSDDKYKDLRASIFLTSKSSRMVSGKISSLFGSYIAEGDTPDTFVLRYAEVLLNKAEALAMLDREDEAIDVLKELLETRYENGIYPEITERGEDLVNLIRDERRKELCFEGHRWFDLRRYAVNPKYPLTDYKIIHGVYAEKPESGQAAQIGYCVLEMYPKGKGWILPIPEYEINVNPEIGHNEREDAEYVEF